MSIDSELVIATTSILSSVENSDGMDQFCGNAIEHKEFMTTIEKAFTLLSQICQFQNLSVPEWRGVVGIFSGVLPTLALDGSELTSLRLFNLTLTHMGRSNRKTTFLRLLNAIKFLVLDFPSISKIASKFLWEFLSYVDGTKIVVAPYHAKISLMTIPMSAVKKFGVVTFKNMSS